MLHPSSLVLPLLTVLAGTLAVISRFLRSSAVEQLDSDHVRTARAKGVGERDVVRRHVVRNAMLPVVTLVGLALPAVFTTGLVVEALFNYPGIGLEYFEAALNNDFPLIIGITLLVGALAVVGTLAADLTYAWLDPRVRER